MFSSIKSHFLQQRIVIVVFVLSVINCPAQELPFYVKKKNWWETMSASRSAFLALQRKAYSTSCARFSNWHTLGPIALSSPLARQFDPGAAIKLNEPLNDGVLRWVEQPDWTDGKIVDFEARPLAMQLLYRTVTVRRDTTLQIYLGSDDGIQAWLNGRLLLQHDIHRTCRPNQEIVRLDLSSGVNHLLLKIVNNVGDFAFYFSLLRDHPDALWPLLERDFTDAASRNEMALELVDGIWPAQGAADDSKQLTARYWRAIENSYRKQGLTPEKGASRQPLAEMRKKYLEVRNMESDYFRDGQVQIICSSHQDIAWMDSPQKCMEQRDEQVITPALALMQQEPSYCYNMESMMNLMEYLQRHPDRQEEIRQLTAAGRFTWGATYNQPYEALLSGEQLVRQVYLGRKWIKKNMRGCNALVAWNPDVPSRTLQMQQILCKAGIPYLIISRHEKGIFRWASPDGSSLLVFSSGHYGNPMAILDRPTIQAVVGIKDELQSWSDYYKTRKLPPYFNMLYSNDATGPRLFSELVELGKNQAEATAGSLLPQTVHATAEQFFKAIDQDSIQVATLCGERPNVWLYIHGPTHHWAISSKRLAGVLLPAAETFSTIEALLAGDFQGYPQERLNEAWAAAIFDDHGWGGNQGQITDQLFRSKLDFAAQQGQALLQEALNKIAGRIQVDRNLGQPIVVFNSLSWQRSDPVIFTLQGSQPIKIVDSKGSVYPHQVLAPDADQPLDAQKIMFCTEDVPSVGYRVYYAVADKKAKRAVLPPTLSTDVWENRFYKVQLAPGGIRQIYDKELQRNILKEGGLLGGEVFTLQSVGNGAGEFNDVQQPTMDGFDKSSLHQPAWHVTAAGPLFTQLTLRVPFSGCTLIETLTLFNDRKQIDCDLSLLGWNGTPYREFRMAFPLNMAEGKISYEVPMAVVTVGKDEIPGAAGFAYGTLDYSVPCAKVHPREVQNFISANDDHFGVTMSSSVAVCDYIDPTDAQNSCPVLQPILLASRKSCHGNGNWYLQEGDHHYHFSLFSHAAGWTHGYRPAIQANQPLWPVLTAPASAEPLLPEAKSFCEISSGNVLLTALKKCEDDDQVILRCVDMEGKDSQIRIKTFLPLQAALQTNIIEEAVKPLTINKSGVDVFIGHHAIETIKVKPLMARR